MKKAACQHALLVFGIQTGLGGEALEHIGNKAAAGAGGAFTADFLVVEKGAETGCRGLVGSEQGAQCGMAGGQVVELAIGYEFLIDTPE